MPKLLTVRKQKWASKFKPDVVRGVALSYNVAAELRYYDRLRKLILKMSAIVEKELKAFFKTGTAKEYFAADASVASQARMLTDALTRQFDDLFAEQAKPIAESAVEEASATSARTLQTSLKQLSGGLTLKADIFTASLREVMNASITENVGLIKSIPAQYLQGVQGAVMRSITTGNGLADLVPFLKQHEGVTLRRARFIAVDQTRKATANLNKGRMQALNLNQFEWLHSAGSLEPRPLHREYNGKIFDLRNPPVIDLRTGERGIPGQLINCRCTMIPVLKFSEEQTDE